MFLELYFYKIKLEVGLDITNIEFYVDFFI